MKALLAVLGTGSAGTRHLRVLSREFRKRIIAVPVRSARVQELRAQGLLAAVDLREAARDGTTLAIIATDTSRHVSDAIEAMSSGHDVLVEKPLAANAREAYRLLNKAAELKRGLFTGCVMRFNEALNVFRKRLPSAGALHSVKIESRSYLPDWRPNRPYAESYSAREAEGGVLRDMIHEIDYAGWLFGWPKSVSARVANLGRLGIASDEIAEVHWVTSGGCRVSVHLDFLTRPARRRMLACGEKGTLEWNGIDGTVSSEIEGGSQEFRSSQDRDAAFLDQARAFISFRQGDSDSRLATGQEGARALAVCDAARRASDSRQESPVEYPLNS